MWAQLKDEIEDNLKSQIFLRHSQKHTAANNSEIVALCQTAQTLTKMGDLFNDRTWRELEHQILWKVSDAELNGFQLAKNEACGLAYAVVSRSPYPTSKLLNNLIEDELLKHDKTLEKTDLRLLLHLIAKVCKNDFGSDKFHRNFVSLDNLKKLARV